MEHLLVVAALVVAFLNASPAVQPGPDVWRAAMEPRGSMAETRAPATGDTASPLHPSPAAPGPEAEILEWALAYPHARTGPLAPPEAGDEREARLRGIARAALQVAQKPTSREWRGVSEGGVRPQRRDMRRAYALLVLTAGESGAWDPRVHAGLDHPVWHQDHGRARCLGQLHQNRRLTPERWSALAGLDEEATERCLSETLRLLDFAVRYCRVTYDEPGLALAYAAYGNGGRCVATQESRRRARLFARALATGRP